MILFSETKQSFYDSDIYYSNLPDDCVEVSTSKHANLLDKINAGYFIFSDLSYSTQRPDIYHIFNGTEWIDTRTDEEKYTAYLSTLKNLTRRQFKLTLLEYGLLDEIDEKIAAIEDKTTRQRIQIEYSEALEFSRTSNTIAYMCQMLGLSDDKINEMWESAMQIEI